MFYEFFFIYRAYQISNKKTCITYLTDADINTTTVSKITLLFDILHIDIYLIKIILFGALMDQANLT